MIIISWHGTGSPTEIFNGSVFKEVLSVFITASILKFLQGTYSLSLLSSSHFCLFRNEFRSDITSAYGCLWFSPLYDLILSVRDSYPYLMRHCEELNLSQKLKKLHIFQCFSIHSSQFYIMFCRNVL
jgi:hypothetical protein